jgi:hypothetical protein
VDVLGSFFLGSSGTTSATLNFGIKIFLSILKCDFDALVGLLKFIFNDSARIFVKI